MSKKTFVLSKSFAKSLVVGVFSALLIASPLSTAVADEPGSNPDSNPNQVSYPDHSSNPNHTSYNAEPEHAYNTEAQNASMTSNTTQPGSAQPRKSSKRSKKHRSHKHHRTSGKSHSTEKRVKSSRR